MDTIKTAVVVALLLAVLYGVYTVLNKETAPPPADVTSFTEQDDLLAPPDVEFGLDESPTLDVDVESDSGTDDAASTGPSATAPIYAEVPAPDAAGADATGADATGADEAAASTLAANSTNPRVYAEVEPLRSTVPPPTAVPPANSPTTPAPDATLQLEPNAGERAAAHEPSSSLPPISSTAPSGPTSVYGRAQGAQDAATASADTTSPELGSAPGSDEVAGAESVPPPSSDAGPVNQTRLAATRFADIKRQADQQIADRDYRGALATLSAIYGEPTLAPEELQQLLAMLDPLAGKVIYSREHLLEPAYTVRGGETLQQIAQQYNVPWQLLHNINRDSVPNPDVMLPGTELKVVRGPFRAEVDVDGAELTLFLDQLYAGRFPVMVGNEPSPAPGDYAVQDKQEGRTYFAQDGRTIPPTAADNPYGSVWLDLGVNNLCIHGSAQRDGAPGSGCIGLSPRDARDIYGILSQGSRVTVYR